MIRDKNGRFVKGSGSSLSKEHKKKISEALRGNKNSLGFKHTEDSKKKMSESQKGRESYWKGKKLPLEMCEKIRTSLSGEKCYAWKGGTRKKNGYIQIYYPGHPFCDKKKYVFEHRLVMEKHIGRYLNPDEVVHHINGEKTDNSIGNLMLFSNNSLHGRHHKFMREQIIFT